MSTQSKIERATARVNESSGSSLFSPSRFSSDLKRALDEDLRHIGNPNAIQRYFSEAQSNALLKKFVDPTSKDRSTKTQAINQFLLVNEHVSRFRLFDVYGDWFSSLDSLVYPKKVTRGQEAMEHRASMQRYYNRLREHSTVAVMLYRARSLIREILGSFDMNELFEHAKHGPNTSQGVPFMDTGCSRKFKPPFTATEDVLQLWHWYLGWDSTLANNLRLEYRLKYTDSLTLPPMVSTVTSSRLTTVPKNDETDRVIAVEATLNMFFQQGMNRVLTDRFSSFIGFDLEHLPEHHRDQAFLASLSRKFATIDLTSASDTVGFQLVKLLVPPIWFKWLSAMSTRFVRFEKREIELHAFSTMGNGATFALETLIFYALAYGYLTRNALSPVHEYEHLKDISVFGDDILCPDGEAAGLLQALADIGILPNQRKSFWGEKQPFRESCGADFLSGYNVRPFYLKGPRSLKRSVLRAWRYSVWNGVLKKMISIFGPRNYAYTKTLALIANVISKEDRELLVVLGDDPDDSGIKLGGDDERLLRLFSIKPMVIFCNNGLNYRMLVSVPPPLGTVTDSVELWRSLKFWSSSRSVFDLVRQPGVSPRDPARPIEKRDRGYQVCWVWRP